jgi:hypothetical protein
MLWRPDAPSAIFLLGSSYRQFRALAATVEGSTLALSTEGPYPAAASVRTAIIGILLSSSASLWPATKALSWRPAQEIAIIAT